MAKKGNQLARADGVQVFELTMDNPEDQDELNRQLRKPGESNSSNSAAMLGRGVNGESITESAEKKSRAKDQI
jgi:hypothetical protein